MQTWAIKRGEYNVPKDIVQTVKALCNGYKRREVDIRCNSKDEKIIETYKMLNEAIDRALEKVEPSLRKDIMFDIVNGLGWKYTQVYFTGRDLYYITKKKFIHDVAVELGLWNPLVITKPKRH